MEEYYQRQLDCLCGQVRPLSEEAKEASVCHWDGIAKPLNGLGRFETILTQIAGIQRTENSLSTARQLSCSARTTGLWKRA